MAEESVRVYKMRPQGQDGLNVVISIPPDIIEAESKKYNLTVSEFIEQFRVVAQPHVPGLHYEFIRVSNGGNHNAERG